MSGDVLRAGFTFDSPGRTITETDIVQFAGLSGDFNRIHVDDEYARQTRFGRRIAHGLLVLSVMSGLTTQAAGYRAIEPRVVAMIDLSCRFPKPTFVGDTLFVRITVASAAPSRKAGVQEIVFRREAINQRGEVVAVADFRMLIKDEETTA